MAFDEAKQGTVSLPTRYFDASRLAFTLGYGASLSSPLPTIDVDLFAQVHALLPRTIDSDGDTPSSGQVSGTVLAAGLLAGVRF